MNLSFLMGLICGCPPGAAIETIPVENCPESLGQLQKVIFQRLKKADGTNNEIVIGTDNPALLATWTALKAATDGTKVQASPFITNPEVEPGSARTYGGGNQTLGGVEIVLGSEPTTFEGMILNSKQTTIAALKKYMCEGVGVYLVDENGVIAGAADDLTTPTKIRPFPIQGLFVSDKKLGGYEEPDSNVISWAWTPNWSDTFYMVTPTDFSATTDL